MGITARTDDLGRLIADMGRTVDQMDSRTALVVRKAAFDVERYAKQLVPVDTGNLKNSIHTETRFQAGRFHEALVIADADYAVFVEAGTSRMAPQPYMGPAAARVEPGFLAALEQIAGNPLESR